MFGAVCQYDVGWRRPAAPPPWAAATRPPPASPPGTGPPRPPTPAARGCPGAIPSPLPTGGRPSIGLVRPQPCWSGWGWGGGHGGWFKDGWPDGALHTAHEFIGALFLKSNPGFKDAPPPGIAVLNDCADSLASRVEDSVGLVQAFEMASSCCASHFDPWKPSGSLFSFTFTGGGGGVSRPLFGRPEGGWGGGSLSSYLYIRAKLTTADNGCPTHLVGFPRQHANTVFGSFAVLLFWKNIMCFSLEAGVLFSG